MHPLPPRQVQFDAWRRELPGVRRRHDDGRRRHARGILLHRGVQCRQVRGARLSVVQRMSLWQVHRRDWLERVPRLRSGVCDRARSDHRFRVQRVRGWDVRERGGAAVLPVSDGAVLLDGGFNVLLRMRAG